MPEQSWLNTNTVNRRLCWVIIFLVFIIGAMAFSYTLILPLKEIEVRYVEFSSDGNHFVQVISANDVLTTNDTLLSVTVRDYVVSRETVDKITSDERLNKVLHMSSSEVFERFKLSNRKIIMEGENGFKRSIEVIRDNRLGKGIHEVAFKTHDRAPMSIDATTTKWKAILHYRVLPKKTVKFEDSFKNPTNIEIVNYTISKEK